MKIAIEGCAHGELETIYNTIQLLEEKENIKVDLLICCGDFQSTRNVPDLRCMACPVKYQHICTFYKYYSGEKTAPILTIFIGGNHEASNYLQELPYGGWVAPNIYYLGYAGVVQVAGVRIAGLSGIYKGHDFLRGHFERAPYSEDTKRSVYHIRNLEVFRLKQLTGKIDICLSHDWPRGVYHTGDADQLMRFKPHFRDEILENRLGSRPAEELLYHLRPSYWFAAHLHCKFAGIVQHPDGRSTRFLALDKCLPRRRFLQVVDIDHNSDKDIRLEYDLQWLTVLQLTNHLLSVKAQFNYLPDEKSTERFQFTPSEDELALVQSRFDTLIIPENFVKTAESYSPQDSDDGCSIMPSASTNPQTEVFCERLRIDDPLQLVLLSTPQESFLRTPDCSADTFIDSMSDISQTPSRRLVLPAPRALDPSDDISDQLKKTSDVNIVEKGDEIQETVTIPSKKFKRRNASLYDT